MSDDPIGAALAEWTAGLSPAAARVACFERVRDLPFRYPSTRDPRGVLEAGAGSCSGKHYLLGELFRRLGVPVRHMVCSHRFNDSPLFLLNNLEAIGPVTRLAGTEAGGAVVVPPIKARDFNFTSLSDAV